MPAERETILSLKLTDGSVINGKINLKTYDRLSDVLNSEAAPFLIVYNAFMNGRQKITIFINKQHILWIEPMDEEINE